MKPSVSSESSSLRRSLSAPSLFCGGSTAAEFCGGTTAGFAAICCCGPCSVVNLVVLTVYKVPRRLCRRAIRRMRRRRLAKRLSNVGSSQFAVHPFDDDIEKSATDIDLPEEEEEEEEEGDEAVVALEKEMWNRFYGGGFWRSHSQAETASSSKTD